MEIGGITTAKWVKTIDLSYRWKEKWTNENIHEMGKWVANQIKFVVKDYEDYDKYGFELEEIIQGFEQTPTQQESDKLNKGNYQFHIKQLEKGEDSWYHEEVPIEWFDERMAELYDFCDEYRFWVKTNF